MKRWLQFLALVGCVLLSRPGLAVQDAIGNGPAKEDSPPIDSRFSVVPQPAAPVHLTLVETKLDGLDCYARLTLHNDTTKPVTGYDIERVADYENADGDWRGMGGSGTPLLPGDDMPIEVEWGDKDAIISGKPFGALKRVRFDVASVRFADGTEWREPNSLFVQTFPGETRPN